ncbi:VOC family protein [Actinomycetospora termitidis]|uniref:VOC family protein n=1 Tax=Actinomycetospora termitidis TaxID=3053470 RepID=A0ABT7MA51_9PSEU|nr:VOC family protein [Actinomycetospora sp. Odt1-22]MDL5157535.1 VOC family protein [Actinomycetospora sp. Odt1-22]
MTETPRAGTVAHIAINADDLDASRAFYEAVLDWRFTPWGPPEFFHVQGPDGSSPGVLGALQRRRTFDDGTMAPIEVTVAVDDVAACCAAARASGGRVLMEATVISGVGELAFVADPGGTPIGLMRYDAAAD